MDIMQFEEAQRHAEMAMQMYERYRPFIEQAQRQAEMMRPFIEQAQRQAEMMRPFIEQAQRQAEMHQLEPVKYCVVEQYRPDVSVDEPKRGRIGFRMPDEPDDTPDETPPEPRRRIGF